MQPLTTTNCIICQFPVVTTDLTNHALETSCEPVPHMFHYACLNPWLTEHDICPLDRLKISYITNKTTEEKLSLYNFRYRNTFLKEFARVGDIGLINDLIGRGIDINAGMKINEETPLDIAVQNNQLPVAEFLMSKGADSLNAINSMAYKLSNGIDLPKDLSKARQLYQLAADKGDASAQFNIGVMLAVGRGGEQDDERARHFYQLAADQGDATSQYNLGVMLQIGRGGEQDYDRARYFYQLAAEQGNAAAQYNLGLVLAHGLGGEQDYEHARHFYQLSADQGDANAQCSLGIMLENGLGGEQDVERARHFYQLAVDQGHANAQCNLGVMLKKGLGGEQDVEWARHLYQLAADQGNAAAQFNLGRMLENGRGGEQARHLTQPAAEQGNVVRKPFSCGVCDKAFTQKSHLARHRRSHNR